MSESIRVLYVSGSTTGSSPPLAAHDEFDVSTVKGISAGQDRLSVAAPDCIVVAPEAIATADKSAIESLWNTAPRCPCLLAPPPMEPPVVGEGTTTTTAPGDDQTTPDPTTTLAARIRTSVDASPTADDSDTGSAESMTADAGSIEAKAIKTTSTVNDRDELPSDTERKASADSEPAYRSLVEDGLAISTVGIFVLDKDFSVVWLNEGIEEYFGVDRENIIGKDKRRLITDRLKYIFAEPDRFAETVCATYDDNTYVEQFDCHVVGDETRADRWLEHSSYPIPDGPYAGGRIEHYVDITEQQAARKQLEQQNERLAEFASIASHDLRNPLHVIGSSLELAKRPASPNISSAHNGLSVGWNS
jgi:PAS fold.